MLSSLDANVGTCVDLKYINTHPLPIKKRSGGSTIPQDAPTKFTVIDWSAEGKLENETIKARDGQEVRRDATKFTILDWSPEGKPSKDILETRDSNDAVIIFNVPPRDHSNDAARLDI